MHFFKNVDRSNKETRKFGLCRPKAQKMKVARHCHLAVVRVTTYYDNPREFEFVYE